MEIKIDRPNFIIKYWVWTVTGAEGFAKGKAATEPEAWRLAKDAEKLLKTRFTKPDVEREP